MNRTFQKIAMGVFFSIFSVSAMAAGSAADDISVADPRVRAVPEGQMNSAAFMILKNAGPSDHAVVAAQSPVAKVVELHTHVNEGGMMKMRQIEKIEIKSGSEAVLQPGGLHVMLMGLKQQIKDGDVVPVTLKFEDGSKMELTAPAKKMQMMMKQHQHNSD